MMSQWSGQIRAIVRLEMKKTFLSRRGLWVYLLALMPVLLMAGRSAIVLHDRERLASVAASHPISGDELRSLQPGVTRSEVERKFGEPFSTGRMYRRFGGRRMREIDLYSYTDGTSEFVLRFEDGTLVNVHETERGTLAQDSVIFATMFQFFYLRLIFFGCVGIFTNLFRGELLDKSLHYYLLAPVRREVLLVGKYLAGLIAAVVIFTSSTALQLLARFWHYDRATLAAYLQGSGWHPIVAYLGVTVLACVCYGSVFLMAGLLFRNPIVPAATLLVWEGANVFLPAVLKKLSFIFYLQSLCPVVAPPGNGFSGPLALLMSSAEPAKHAVAVASLLLFSLIVLAIASVRARRLEINYSTD